MLNSKGRSWGFNDISISPCPAILGRRLYYQRDAFFLFAAKSYEEAKA
jgi:hypothetical protein